jgi:hypothetical protein
MTHPSNFEVVYANMNDEQIMHIANQGGLVEDAELALRKELNRRGLTVEKREAHIFRQKREKAEDHAKEKILPFSMGLGFTFYGRNYLSEKDKANDIQLRTKWFVISWIPIFPIASYRFSCNEKSAGFLRWNAEQKLVSRVPLNWTQVCSTWLKFLALITIALCVGAFAASHGFK